VGTVPLSMGKQLLSCDFIKEKIIINMSFFDDEEPKK
jgi:hypothetical protein